MAASGDGRRACPHQRGGVGHGPDHPSTFVEYRLKGRGSDASGDAQHTLNPSFPKAGSSRGGIVGLDGEHGIGPLLGMVGYGHAAEAVGQLRTPVWDLLHDSQFARQCPSGSQQATEQSLAHAAPADELQSNRHLTAIAGRPPLHRE